SVFALLNLAAGYALNGDPAAAERQVKISLELAPQSPKPLMMLAGLSHEKSQDPSALIQSLERAREQAGGSPQGLAELAAGYAHAGRKQDAAKLVTELQRMSRERYVSPYDVATVYLAMNDVENAMPYLEKAYRERSTGMVFLRRPRFASFQSDPRFKSLIEK